MMILRVDLGGYGRGINDGCGDPGLRNFAGIYFQKNV